MRPRVSAAAGSGTGPALWLRGLGLAALVALTGPARPAEAFAPPGEWWNASYLHRQEITVTAGAAVTAPYSISVQLDHATLVGLNQSLASGDDLRVVYWDGAAWVELDRRLDDQSNWNSATTTIWFRTQADILAGASDDDYYIYYGNSSAGAPPANWANVFLFYDDFEDGLWDAGRWSCVEPFGAPTAHYCNEVGGTVSLGPESAIWATPGYAFGVDTRWEARLRMANALPPAGLYYDYFVGTDAAIPADFYSNDWIAIWANDTQHEVETADNGSSSSIVAAPAPATPTSDHVYTFDREGNTAVRFMQDGVQIGYHHAIGPPARPIPDADLRVESYNGTDGADDIVLDWVRVRKYVTPEPTSALEAQEGESVCDVANQMWWDTDWGRRRKITFNNSAQTEDLDNFPVLIRLDSTRIDYTRTQNSGQDLRFVDVDHQTVLDHEIELWDEAGSSYVWVRIPRIDGSSSTDFIWMYYDNGTIGDGQNATGVWDASYRGVWHLRENGGPYAESTANPNPGTTTSAPTRVAGRIGFGQEFDGANNFIDAGNDSSLDLTGAVTLEAWVQLQSLIALSWGADFVGKEDQYRLYHDWDVNQRVTLTIDSPVPPYPSDQPVPLNAWLYVVGVYDGTDNAHIYVDGVLRDTVSGAGAPITSSASPVGIGRDLDDNETFDGLIDEVRISSVPRSGDWVAAQHLSMTDAFVSFSGEVGRCNLRSIGTRGDYGQGGVEGQLTTVSVTQGSHLVTGSGTTWLTSNRGRGDRISILGVDYTVYRVVSDTRLLLSSVYRGIDDTGLTYTIARQFADFSSWEDCIDGPPGTACPFFPVASADYAADNRAEVGIVYADVAQYDIAAAGIVIEDSLTDAAHTITLTADGPNRHNGTQGAGVVLDGQANGSEILVHDPNVTIEWLDLGRFRGADSHGAIRVLNSGAKNVLLQNLLIHTFYDAGFDVSGIRLSGSGGKSVTVRNTMIWAGDSQGIEADEPEDFLLVENCSIDIMAEATARGIYAQASPVTVRNTIVTRSGVFASGGRDFHPGSGGFTAASDNNIDSDGTAPGGASQTVPVAQVPNLYVQEGLDLHLEAGAPAAIDTGIDLSASFINDVDGEIRPGGASWDIGADEFGATTAVDLMSFDAVGADSAVGLSWRTGSELNNLGFHLYRSPSATGPWTRITPSLIPGLGSSPEGASYSFRDTGLVNGVRYFYRLEDIDSESGLHLPRPHLRRPGDRASGTGRRGRAVRPRTTGDV